MAGGSHRFEPECECRHANHEELRGLVKTRAIKPSEVLPAGWRDLITPQHPLAAGLDVATTTKRKSNPSALAIVQKVAGDFIVRAVARWKTGDPRATAAVLDELLALPHGLRLRRLVIDATSERFFAAEQRARLAGRVVVELVVRSEATTYRGEAMNWKTYLGNLLVQTCEDGHLLLPEAEWLRADLRSVKRDKGGFVCEVDADGNHGDCFNAIEQALHGVFGADGPATASATSVGNFSVPSPARPGLRNPFAHFFGGSR